MMNTQPKITVVMPSFNQATYLEMAIDSVLDQHYPNLEFMIMDGGSSDGSLDIIQRYSARLSYWKSERDNGQADALQQGFSRSNGDLLGWLNSDDILLPGALNRIAHASHIHPDCGLFAGNILWIDQSDRIIRCKRHPVAAAFFARHAIYIVAQPGSFFRRSDYFAVGGINPVLRYVMDADLYVRMMAKGTRHLHLNAWMAAFRLQGTSKTVAESTPFLNEFEQTRIQAWPSMKPGSVWRLLYLIWQIANGNYVRMGAETLLSRGKKWQDWSEHS